jgi:hypothetical protein
MTLDELFWTEFMRTFAPTLGSVMGLLPVLLIAAGTIGLALRLFHQRHMARIESARQALGLETEEYRVRSARDGVRSYLRWGR